jgi:hypothetical protein
MPSEMNETKHRSSAYYMVLVPGAVLLALAAGWSAFWFFESRMAMAAVTNWMTHEAKLGRNWTCPDRKISGFPFAIDVSCDNLRFQGEVLDETLTGAVRGFHATSPLLRDDNVLARIEPPFTAKSSDGTIDMTMGWDELYVQLEGPPGAYERLSVAGTKVKVQGRMGSLAPLEGGFDEFDSTVYASPERHDDAYNFKLHINNSSIPALNDLLDAQRPIDMHVEATISQAGIGNAKTLAGFLDQWRAANGHVDIAAARLTSGSIQFDAKGDLGLDDKHRVEGKLDAEFAGFNKAFRQLNIDPGVIAAGNVLSGLLGKGSQVPGRLNLPVSLSSGFLSIGPVRTAIQIPPLY